MTGRKASPGAKALLTLSLCSASALGKVVGPPSDLENKPSAFGVDIWQDGEYTPTMYESAPFKTLLYLLQSVVGTWRL